MSQGADLRQFLLDQGKVFAVVADRIHQNHPPEDYEGAYIWFARRGITRADTIDMPEGDPTWSTLWDVEAISRDGDEAIDLGAILEKLHAHRGSFGNDSTVQAIFVADQADDYAAQGLANDEYLEFSALEMEIVGYVTAL